MKINIKNTVTVGTILAFLVMFTSAQAETMCTMDARQCPDGSWVGRSGPNCEFVCPSDQSGGGTSGSNGGGSDSNPTYPASAPSSPTGPNTSSSGNDSALSANDDYDDVKNPNLGENAIQSEELSGFSALVNQITSFVKSLFSWLNW